MTSTELVAGRVWVYPAGLSMSAANRLNLAAHELGHALGLHHFTPNWTDGRQTMYPHLSGTSTYRAGDRAGLKYMAGGYDKPAGAVAGRAYAAGDMHVTGRLSSGSRVRVTVGAVSAEVRTTGGRFAAAVPAPAGSHRVCVTVLDAAPGFRRDLGCAQVTAPGAPFGRIDLASNSFETVSVRGWAADPQTAAPVQVEIRNNGVLVATATATRSRPDVAKVYPHYGALHGYEVHVPAAAGANVVCVRILGVGGGGHKDLGCRTVAHSVDPIGAFEVAVATDLGAVVTGWALDPNTPSPINVTVTVDGLVPPIPGTFQAADERRDIAQKHPAHGPHHGFSTRLVLTPGDHTICLTATNTGLGRDRSIGCTRVRVDTSGQVEGVANPTFSPGTVGQAPGSEIVPVASELLSSTTRSANALLGPVA